MVRGKATDQSVRITSSSDDTTTTVAIDIAASESKTVELTTAAEPVKY